MEPLGARLRHLREAAGLEQKELADRIGREQGTISAWETGRRVPDSTSRKQLAKVLGVPEAYLFVEPTHAQPDLLRVVLEHLGFTPDDLAHLPPEAWEELRKLLTPIIETIVQRHQKGGQAVPATPKAKVVLIIEDDIKTCQSLASALRHRGFVADYAFHGRAAMDRIAGGERPDCLIVDLHMPHMGGVEFLRKIRSLAMKPKVLVITAHPQDVVDLHVDGLAIEGFFEKPFSVQDLLAKLEELLN